MSVISKDLAGKIALKLTEKSRLLSEKLHADFREAVTIAYENSTPKEVVEVFKKHPDWFYTRSQIILEGNGFGYERISSQRPVVANCYSDANLKMTPQIADKLVKYKRKWEKSVKDYKELKSETEQALLSLKTYNNIRKEFPVAYNKFLALVVKSV